MYPEAADYLATLKAKEQKWAFSFTHEHFVAGVSSTQRQESINCQIKASLLSNSSLKHILDDFDHIEQSVANKQLQATVITKLEIIGHDPLIETVSEC